MPVGFTLSSSGSHSNNTKDTKNILCFNGNIMNDNSKQNHPSKNKFGCTLFTELLRRDTRALPSTNLQIVLNTPQKSPLKSSHPKNTCQIFLPKTIPESKISNPQKSLDHPRHTKSEVPPPRDILMMPLTTPNFVRKSLTRNFHLLPIEIV